MAKDKGNAGNKDTAQMQPALMETMDVALLEGLKTATETGALLETMRLGAPPPGDETSAPAEATEPTLHSLRIPTLPRLSLAEAESPHAEAELPTSHRTDLRICGLLGEGGMGHVHLARQHSLGRDVAIKRVKPEQQNAQHKRLLLHEGYITGQLEHPNIVPVHALGRDEKDSPVIVMKRIEGVAWSALINDPSHPAWARVKGWSEDPLERHMEILMEVCSAVAYAHTKGYLHLDIKPDNVMLGPFGEIYLVDWGIARGKQTTQAKEGHGGRAEPPFSFAGTPAYMAPEMLDPVAHVLDERTDVYLLGATLHEILTGQTRHSGDSLTELIGSIALSSPTAYDDDIPNELADLANRATHVEPSQRPPSVDALREALIDFLRHRSSRQLSQRAQHHLQILKQLPEQQASPTEHDTSEHRRHRVFQEALFGFTLALEQWDQNQDAIQGRQDTFEEMIRFQLRQRNVALATALMEELHSPNQALEEALAALRTELEAEAKENEALQAMAKELDPTLSQRSRTGVLLILLGLFGVLIGFFVFSAPGTISRHSISWFTSLGALSVGLIMFSLRKKIFVNAYSKRFVLTFLLIAASLLVHRSLGGLRGTPLPHILNDDLLLIAAITATVGINLHPALLYVALFQLVMVFVMHLFPGAAMPLILGTVLFTILAILHLVRQGKG